MCKVVTHMRALKGWVLQFLLKRENTSVCIKALPAAGHLGARDGVRAVLNTPAARPRALPPLPVRPLARQPLRVRCPGYHHHPPCGHSGVNDHDTCGGNNDPNDTVIDDNDTVMDDNGPNETVTARGVPGAPGASPGTAGCSRACPRTAPPAPGPCRSCRPPPRSPPPYAPRTAVSCAPRRSQGPRHSSTSSALNLRYTICGFCGVLSPGFVNETPPNSSQ